MTLQTYGPDELDELALRALDLASIFRKMSKIYTELGIDVFQLHAKKSNEWFNSLERWATGALTKIESQAIQERGARAAREIISRNL